ncbi:MAG: efflux RND transporter permease subunit [Myxococcota bacterium]
MTAEPDEIEPEIRGLYGWAHRNATLLWVTTAAFAVFGGWTLFRMPSGIYPEVDFPRIVVVAHAGDAPADVTVATVARPLEEAVADTPGVRRVKSKTIRGSTELSVEFAPGVDMARALAQVESRANEVKGDLPDGAEIVAERLSPTSFPVLTFNLTGTQSPADLLDLANTVVRPAMTRVDGVGRVEVMGGDVRELEVEVDPDRAAGLRLDGPKVADLLADSVVRATAGHLVDHHQTVTLEAESQPLDAKALGALPITAHNGAIVPLSAVADVHPGTADRAAVVSGPLGETVQIAISRREGASTPAGADGARAAAAALLSVLPPGTRLDEVYDQAALVDDSLASVRDAIVIGILLCVGVLGVFLRDLRAGLIAGLAVPLTLLLTFGVMYLFGQTLNLMSLGGMAVAIGLVVDDAVVVVEAIHKHREEGLSGPMAASRGVSELFSAVLGRTATTVVVFLPLGLLSGVVGRFFQALAVTLTGAVLLSLPVALLLAPLAAARFLTSKPHSGPSWLATTYGSLLRRSLRYRGIGIGLALGSMVLGGVALLRVPTGFLPTMDEGGFVIDYWLPAASSLQDTSASAAKVEALLKTIPEVRTWSRRTGAELGPAAATETNTGDIMVRLKPLSERDRSVLEVIDDVRQRVETGVPQSRFEFVQVMQDVLNDLAGAPHPVEIKVFGPDYAVLQQIAGQISEKVAGIDGLEDFYGGVEGVSPVLHFEIDPAATASLGLTPARVTELLDTTVRGRVATQVPYLDRQIDLRVRAPDRVRFDAKALGALPLVPPDDTSPVTTLAAVAHPTNLSGPTLLMREDLRPVVVLSAEQGDRDLGSIIGEMRAALADLTLPSGYSVELGGTYEQQQAAFTELEHVLMLATLAVLVVLLAQFQTLRLPLVVLATAPLGLVGAVLTLWVLQVPLNASSLMGLVLLVGLVVKNGILLLENAQTHRESGADPVEAMIHAGERRIRPILMTALCTVFGLLPLALGIGSGADLQRPLALAVIGGLALSTAVSLFLLPALALGVTKADA